DPVIPLGLLQVMAACPAHHERAVVDLCFEPAPCRTLASRLEELRPELIALGIRNLQGNDYGTPDAQLEHYAALVHTIRSCSDAPLVLGGSGFSVDPLRLMDLLQGDFGIAGEGEEVFRNLVECHEHGGDAGRVPGLLRRIDGRVRANRPRRSFSALTTLPRPDRRWVDPRHYQQCGTDSVQTKRGCSMGCTYCAYPRIEGRTSRLRSADEVADEVREVRDAGAHHFFFVDSVFNLPPRHAEAVCDALIARGTPLPWTCYVNPSRFAPRLAERMRQSGCVGFEVGSDSGSDRVLEQLGKGFGSQHLRDLHRVARDAGLKDCHTFLLGTPDETSDDVERTLDLLHDLDPSAAILMVWQEERVRSTSRLAPAQHRSRERLLSRLREACRDHPRWIVPALGIRFSQPTFRRLRKLGWTGPLWQYLDQIPASSALPRRKC
ncbi:MAG: B12-binding domain-containing radical SAM protein, partial [Myxococcota bacterium]